MCKQTRLALGMWIITTSFSLLVCDVSGQTVSEIQLAPLGTGSLASAAAPIMTSGFGEPSGLTAPRRTKRDVPFAISSIMSAVLHIPNPNSQEVVGPDFNFFGFTGLSVLDNATANGFIFEPPDQGMAAGNGLILEALNLEVAVFSAVTGARLSPVVGLNAFFGLPPVENPVTKKFGPFLSDPKCYFDRATQRWFLTILEADVDPTTGNFTGPTSVLIAVSQTANPLGNYNLYKLPTTNNGTNGTQIHPGCPCIPDQPLIGADEYGFFISANEFPLFGPGFNGADIYAISKLNLAAGLPAKAAEFSGIPLAEGLAFSVQPATSPSTEDQPESGVEYFMSSLDFNNNLDNRIAVWAMTNTRSLSDPNPNVKLLTKVITSETYGFPPSAIQNPFAGFTLFNNGGHLETIDTGDDRMNQVVFANGHLWAGLDTVVGTAANPRAGIAFFIVTPSLQNGNLNASISKQGYVTVAGDSTMYPSIGVTGSGEAAMVLALVGPAGTPVFPRGVFPSFAYTPISIQTGAGDIRLAAPGQTPDDSFSGGPGTPARWGDYTAAVADGENIWMAGERIPGGTRFKGANWGTFIGRIP
jgi:hypothetical protein